MLSVERCEKILNQSENNYTKEQTKKIRDFLSKIAEIEYQKFINQAYDESGNLHQSFN